MVLNERTKVQHSRSYGGFLAGKCSAAMASQGAAYFGPEALIITDRGTYYVAIGLGKVKLDAQIYYCISVDSPIGERLLHKSAGEVITFHGKPTVIESIH